MLTTAALRGRFRLRGTFFQGSTMDAKPTSKKNMQNAFAEMGDRKIVLVGPGNVKLQDSRFAIVDAAADHVVIKLLGEETLVIPYAAVSSVKVERQQVTISYR